MNASATPVPAVVFARSDGDLAAMIEVRTHADQDSHPPLLDNLRNNLAGNPQLAYLVARIGTSPVGCGFVDVSQDIGRAHVLVVPNVRHRGIGTALLVSISERARADGRAQLEGAIKANDHESLQFFTRRGFEKVGGEVAVVLVLDEDDVSVAEPPPGIRIVSRAQMPDVVEEMYDVAREAEPDIPGFGPVRPFDVWRSTEIDRPSLRPELTFIALAGEVVVGYAILDDLRGELWHRLTAVKRAWRKRGIATALKVAQIHAAKEGGAARLITTNEEQNARMRKINQALGYRPEPRLSTIVLRGPLSQPTRAP